jgi:hypothetical protein
MAEVILDGRATTVDIAPLALERFAPPGTLPPRAPAAASAPHGSLDQPTLERATPILEWTWKIVELPAGADIRKKEARERLSLRI